MLLNRRKDKFSKYLREHLLVVLSCLLDSYTITLYCTTGDGKDPKGMLGDFAGEKGSGGDGAKFLSSWESPLGVGSGDPSQKVSTDAVCVT